MQFARRKSLARSIALALVTLVAGAALASAARAAEPATLTIAWLPNDSSDGLAGMRDEIAKVISQATGKKVVNKLTTDYTIAIAALENGDAQIGWFGANEYLTSHAKHPEVIPLVVNTGPSGTLKDALYYSRFVVPKGQEGNYETDGHYSLANIVGKRMAFVSTSSTSGFNMPAAAILGTFGKQPKWKGLTRDELAQGGPGHFFSQVTFAGSHQLSLVSVLMGRADVGAVCDFLVAPDVTLVSGTDNHVGAVYRVKPGEAAPFSAVAGKEFVVIQSIPVLNPPVEVNSRYLDAKTMREITRVLTSDKVADDPKIFAPASQANASDFQRPARFVKVTDAWYDPMRKVLGIR